MKSLILLLAMTTAAIAADPKWTTSNTIGVVTANSCFIASIEDKTYNVTIDWKCVDKEAQKYRDGKSTDISGPMALVMKAIHDGTAKDQ